MEVKMIEITPEEFNHILAERERKIRRDMVNDLTADLEVIVKKIQRLGGYVHVDRVPSKSKSRYLPTCANVAGVERKDNQITLLVA